MTTRWFLMLIFVYVVKVEGISQNSIVDYIEDSSYYFILDKISHDTTPNSNNLALKYLNLGTEKYEKYLKEDSFYYYFSFAFRNWPHESYYSSFDLGDELKENILSTYPKFNPKSFKLMMYVKDSLEKVYIKPLQMFLAELYKSDQSDRFRMDNSMSTSKTRNLDKMKAEVDRHDLVRISKIDSLLIIFGFPGKSLVGVKYANYAWTIIHHNLSLNTEKYMTILEKAMIKGELSKSNYAYSVDQYLLSKGRKQIFGTQYNLIQNDIVFFPIGDIQHLDDRRRNFDLSPFNIFNKSIRSEMDNKLKDK